MNRKFIKALNCALKNQQDADIASAEFADFDSRIQREEVEYNSTSFSFL